MNRDCSFVGDEKRDLRHFSGAFIKITDVRKFTEMIQLKYFKDQRTVTASYSTHSYVRSFTQLSAH